VQKSIFLTCEETQNPKDATHSSHCTENQTLMFPTSIHAQLKSYKHDITTFLNMNIKHHHHQGIITIVAFPTFNINEHPKKDKIKFE